MEGYRIFIASGNAPSSHILKPPIRDLKDTVGNEAFSMMLAQRLGLPVPEVTIRGGLDRIFIIARYDRSRDTDGRIVRLHLLRWTIFNFLIGNADAHAKNLAIVFTEQVPRLAPFYDLICTQVYPDLMEKQAMRIGDENRPSWILRKHWEELSESIVIKPGFVLKTL